MTWKTFEKLGYQIYQELEPEAKVTWNDHIVGKLSGRRRQIDISIRRNFGGKELLKVIEVKDRNRPAGIQAIDAFIGFLQDVVATDGILICKGGFTASALTYAKAHHIDLCKLHDAQTRRWELDVKIPILWIDFFPKVTLNLDVEIEGLEKIEIQKDPKLWMIIIIDENNKHRANTTIQNIFANLWGDERVWKEPNTNYSMDCNVKDMHLMIRIPNGQLSYRKIKKLKMDYVVSKKSCYGYFTPEECRGILNESNGEFLPSFLPMGQIPVKRDNSWTPIDNPEDSAINFPAYFVTVENWQLELGNDSHVFEKAIFNLKNNQP
jgi:hypothetical protein